MTALTELAETQRTRRDPFEWLGSVLTNFAAAEQAIGQLCIRLDLPLHNGASGEHLV